MNAANPFPSVLSLEKKIRSYFRKSFNEDVVIFCDNCDLTWFKTETVNVVLLGNALRDLQHVVHWPKNSKFKIWVLNHALKRQLTYFYGIDPKVVNVINRYDLYKREEKGIKFPEQDLNFVYSARASRLKNFELILNVLNQLSLSRNQKIPFYLCGPSFQKENFERFINDEHNKNLDIQLLGDLGPGWADHKLFNDSSILISLSADPFDDYSVSTAEWQAKGRSTVVANLGPYSELEGGNVRKISAELLFRGMILKDQQIVDQIIQEMLSLRLPEFNKSPNGTDSITREELLNNINGIDEVLRNKIMGLSTYQFNDFTREVLSV